MKRAPWSGLVVEGLIVDGAMRDALMGDLAEEWEERAANEGERSANRWYRREAFRTVPSLLLEWPRSAGWKLIVWTLAAGMIVRFVTMLPGAITGVALMYPTRALGGGVLPGAFVYALSDAAWAFWAGTLVVLLVRRAPISGLLWLVLLIVLTGVSTHDIPTISAAYAWYIFVDKASSLTAALMGGVFMLRVRDWRSEVQRQSL